MSRQAKQKSSKTLKSSGKQSRIGQRKANASSKPKAAKGAKAAKGVRGTKTGRDTKVVGGAKPPSQRLTEKADASASAGSKTAPKIAAKATANTTVSNMAYFVEVDENHAGQRLDNFLITHLKGVPRTRVYRIIRKGEVRVNKGRAKQTTRLEQGDSIRIPPIRQSDPKLLSGDSSRYEFLNQSVLFEDDALLVLNKPSGMAVHAGSGISVGVIEALRVLRTDLKYIELVHRLDRETSGCLVLAKKSSVLKSLHEDFKNNSQKNSRLDKRYMCLVKGKWKYGKRTVNKPLNTEARRQGERIVVVDDTGSYASSIMWPLRSNKVASLLEVKLLTGRTHQVRVHAESENHPIAGDQKYGDRIFNTDMKQHNLKRLFLHAASITLIHPMSQTSLKVVAPLPKELQLVLDSLDLGADQCMN